MTEFRYYFIFIRCLHIITEWKILSLCFFECPCSQSLHTLGLEQQHKFTKSFLGEGVQSFEFFIYLFSPVYVAD